METKNTIDEKQSYVTFSLGRESFAIPVLSVLEITISESLTNVPNAPSFIEGILNFRGEIIPVVNLHRRFNKPRVERDENMIVVVDMNTGKKNTHMGLLVDDVMDVIEFRFADINKTPEMGISYDQDFLQGVVDHELQFLMVLNLEKVLHMKAISGVAAT